MSRVFWDTNIFIYFFEHRGSEGRSARGLRERMLARGDQLITSAMTVGEILVKPRERQDLDLCKAYERAITATALVLPFDLNAATTTGTITTASIFAYESTTLNTASSGVYNLGFCVVEAR